MKRSIIPARVYAQVICPDCGFVMVNHGDYVTCLTEGCDHHRVRYELPMVTLVERMKGRGQRAEGRGGA